MNSSLQHTLKKNVMFVGIGLHTGKEVRLVIKPAPVNSGIRFVRKDVEPKVLIPARIQYVTDVRFATTIGIGNSTVSTIEHLMSAFAGAGIDNAIVELDGPEVPASDGSAYSFCVLLDKAGKKEQKQPRRYLKILRPVTVRNGDSFICIEPCSNMKVTLEIDFNHPLIAKQRFSGVLDEQSYIEKISRARTFGFLKEVEMMQANGLALGGSFDNAVVLSERSVLNEGGLRFPDEFVKHKVLDLLGDLYLAGMPILGHVKGFKTGHMVHSQLLQAILSNSDNYEVTEKEVPPVKKSFWAAQGKEASAAVANI